MGTRLNKYIAEAGVTSRRKADEMIAAGRVCVAGKVVRTLGALVEDGEAVTVDGREIRAIEKRYYIALNKPKGFITTTADEKDRPTVMDLVADAGERLFPVGRLDGDTTGLLIMTNDGDFAYRMSHPKHAMEKTYRAHITGVLSKEKLARLRRGVEIDGRVTAPAFVEIIKQGEKSATAEIRIHEGRNRQIRKMFAAVGSRVLELERTQVGPVRLGNLKAGHWRKLTPRELEALK
ncbi:MAG: rRNA pseudouridine synthase [Clostridiales Family XIII bacterium]|jgi:23S rRNA pseudouridine2605 synthase|nr:rRNA pseudouridine synthase [Clostridiales Family XIII bacterium]